MKSLKESKLDAIRKTTITGISHIVYENNGIYGSQSEAIYPGKRYLLKIVKKGDNILVYEGEKEIEKISLKKPIEKPDTKIKVSKTKKESKETEKIPDSE